MADDDLFGGLAVLRIILQMLTSILGGLLAFAYGDSLGRRTILFCNLVFAAAEGSSYIFTSAIFEHFFTESSSLWSSYFRWHMLLFLPTIWLYIRRLSTDDDFLRDMSVVEIRTWILFAPTIISAALKLLWSLGRIGVLLIAAALGLWVFCPQPWRSRFIVKGLKSFISSVQFFFRLDLSFRRLFMYGYENLMIPFDNWEIEGARQKKKSRLPYQYQPLETPRHIRLLRLKKRQPFSEVSCDLLHVSLDDCPAYEALSYTWGPKEPSIPVEVNGQQVLVTQAVDDLLHHHRSIFDAKLLWIDAICINQSNSDEGRDEKAVQLPLMTQIYGLASRVIIWLSPPSSAKEAASIRKLVRALSYPSFGQPVGILLSLLFSDNEIPFLLMAELFSHPWFERIWVLQEVAIPVNAHIMYKGVTVEWDTVAAAAQRIDSDPMLHTELHFYLSPKTKETSSELGLESPVSRIDQLRWQFLGYMSTVRRQIHGGETLPLHVLVILTRLFKSKDPRDKIYGLLGIATDGKDLPFTPNYNDPSELVYLRSTTFFLTCERWFGVLSSVGRGYESPTLQARSAFEHSLPSWVPDYSTDFIAGARAPIASNVLRRDTTATVGFTSSSRIIKLEAVLFDSVQFVGPGAKLRTNSLLLPDARAVDDEKFGEQMKHYLTNSSKEMAQWYRKAQQLARDFYASINRSQQSADRELWEMCMNEGSGSQFDRSEADADLIFTLESEDARKLFELFNFTPVDELLRFNGASLGPGITTAKVVDMEMSIVRKIGAVTGKAFCITMSGNMALMPPLVKVGDRLAHIRGGYIPLVLRSSDEAEGLEVLIGCCYVHGVDDVYTGDNWKDCFIE